MELSPYKSMTICSRLVLECKHILILALDFFQRSSNQMIPISYKGSYNKQESFWFVGIFIGWLIVYLICYFNDFSFIGVSHGSFK